MRQVLSGAGVDTTATVLAYLQSKLNQFSFANLYLIGDRYDPQALFLTDWSSPLSYPLYGNFLTTMITRGPITSKVGLEVATLDVSWSPLVTAPSASIATANAYQLAQNGFYDNKIVKVFQAFMPTQGDANSYGCAVMFGGRIGQTTIERGVIGFTINSFLDVVNEKVPTQVITTTSQLASGAGATPPAGDSAVPQFNIIDGSSSAVIIAQCVSPTAGKIYGPGALSGGYIIFNGGTGATLSRVLARIATNDEITVSGPFHYNRFYLYAPLPWPPTPGVDTLYVSASAPVAQGMLVAVAVAGGGGSYVVGDLLTIDGGSATVQVTSAPGGVIAAVQINNPGSGYATASGVGSSGGSGTGATFDISTYSYQGFPYVPAPQNAV